MARATNTEMSDEGLGEDEEPKEIGLELRSEILYAESLMSMYARN